MSDGDQPDDAQKTEDPTQKRIQESRKKGQVAVSREVNNWLMLLAATMIVVVLAPSVFKDLKLYLQTFIAQADMLPGAPGGIGIILADLFFNMLRVMALPFIFLMVFAAAGPLLQTGPLFAPESIKPDLSKVSPMKGFKRLFSMRSLMEFAKGIVKLALIGVVGAMILYPFYGQIDHMVGLPIDFMLGELMILFTRLMIGVLIVLAIIAMIDLVYQRMEQQKKLRMTKQEVKDEYRQSEGDPEIKARLRALRQQRAQQRMMQNVPKADVVITNPTHYSIALQYDGEGMEAPVCVAKGLDEVALRIQEVAREHDIILYENKPLAHALYDTVDIDQEIPHDQYKAVAEVISYVLQLRGKR